MSYLSLWIWQCIKLLKTINFKDDKKHWKTSMFFGKSKILSDLSMSHLFMSDLAQWIQKCLKFVKTINFKDDKKHWKTSMFFGNSKYCQIYVCPTYSCLICHCEYANV